MVKTAFFLQLFKPTPMPTGLVASMIADLLGGYLVFLGENLITGPLKATCCRRSKESKVSSEALANAMANSNGSASSLH
uniref:Uncharacterized protein n=1 Tax=Cannabis sativa TaxID=3483 RepID=A0A803NTU6_CANSA